MSPHSLPATSGVELTSAIVDDPPHFAGRPLASLGWTRFAAGRGVTRLPDPCPTPALSLFDVMSPAHETPDESFRPGPCSSL